MKYIKTFENIDNDEPEAGDYVLINIGKYENIIKIIPNMSERTLKYINFINDNIGIIRYKTINKTNEEKEITVEYENVPKDIESYFDLNYNLCYRSFDYSKIIDFASTKQQLKLKLTANKYNL